MTKPNPHQRTVTFRAVKKGERIATPAETFGFVHAPAPCDGIVIETDDDALFLPVSVARAELRKLGKR